MTAAGRTTAASPERKRDFNDFFFWYVAVQVLGISTFVLTLSVVSYVGNSFHLLGQEWADNWAHSDGPVRCAILLLSLVACVTIASAHKLGFWRGFVGWLAGNALVTIIFAPMVLAESAVVGGDSGGFYRLLAITLLYLIGSIVAMIWKRRHAARALSEREVLRRFE